MKVKTSELTRAALDWGVAKCEDLEVWHQPHFVTTTPIGKLIDWDEAKEYSPSTDWSQGGPIIERERIATQPLGGGWFAGIGSGPNRSSWSAHGPTPLIAAMRCYVASKLGDEVEVPEELMDLQRLPAGSGSGEPVAWGQLGTLNGQLFLRSNYDRTPYPPPPSIVRNLNLVPLYTAPQSREPLTDEQINQLWCACLSIENHAFSRDFARAIERAHGIRSEG